MAYTLTGRKSGTVRFEPMQNGLIDKESESYSSSVTSNPIENGAEINDHVNNAAGILNLSGIIIGGESAINALKAMRDSRDLLTYTGVTRMTNLVFTSLKFDRSYKNAGGATFAATLKQILMGTTEYIPMNAEEPMSSQDSGKSTDKQLSKTVSVGMKTVASQSVSSTSVERKESAYKGSSNLSPLTRVTAAYNGLSAY